MSKKKRLEKAVPKAIGSKETTDKSILVPQRGKIDYPLTIRQRDDLTEKQKQLINLILDKNVKIIFVSGPAGTSKTYTSVLGGLELMNKKAVSDIVYVRSAVESASKSLGFLPGEAGDKMEPYMRPLQDKLEEILPINEVKALIKDERVDVVPINYLRGASFNAKFIICDEAQNLEFKEHITLLTRVGQFSKLIITADPDQSDINGKSGFAKMFDIFNDEESRSNGIHCFSFTKADIVRSGVVKYIAERLENYKLASLKSEPMFPAK